MGMTSYWSTNQVHRNLNLFHGVEILMYIGTESDEESAGALLPGNSSVPKKGTYANNVGRIVCHIEKIRAWLSPTDYLSDSSEYRKHLNSHVEGTGGWVHETDQYRQWHDSLNVGGLWIRGIPGSGKSVVAATLIQKLAEAEQAPVLFFFFRHIIIARPIL